MTLLDIQFPNQQNSHCQHHGNGTLFVVCQLEQENQHRDVQQHLDKSHSRPQINSHCLAVSVDHVGY